MNAQGTNGDLFLQTTAAGQQLAAAGRHFFQAKGLAQHVFSAGVQQRHHGFGPCAGRQHHHRAAQLGAQLECCGFLEQFSADQQVGLLIQAQLHGLSG